MNRQEYAGMVDWIEDRWGRVDSWANPERVYGDFEAIPADVAWSCLVARTSGDPDAAKWPPKPAELRALAIDRMRHTAPRAIPATSSADRRTWAEWSRDTYGEVIPLSVAVERRAEELAGRG